MRKHHKPNTAIVIEACPKCGAATELDNPITHEDECDTSKLWGRCPECEADVEIDLDDTEPDRD
jgi:hypothetical protein